MTLHSICLLFFFFFPLSFPTRPPYGCRFHLIWSLSSVLSSSIPFQMWFPYRTPMFQSPLSHIRLILVTFYTFTWTARLILRYLTESVIYYHPLPPPLMCSIHLHFKTFPHFPASIWIFITLKYLGPSSLHSSPRWMASSGADWSRHGFHFDSTHTNVTCENHTQEVLLSNHIKSPSLSNINRFN